MDQRLTVDDRVQRHYARRDLESAILDALAAVGKDINQLTPDDLAPVDEFHTGGRQETVELASYVDFASGSHILDVGCGIGGPSRFFASQRGCRVTGIDMTEDYVRTARTLAQRVGLGERVSYRQASAIDLPFGDAEFDGAYMMHVGMNIQDKARLFAEVHRVLKPKGTFAVYDVMRTGDGELRFPLHWASTPETSFVVGAAEYRTAAETAGFEIAKQVDRGDFARAFFREVAARTADAGGPPPLGIHILMKSDIAAKLANVTSGVESGVIAPVVLICRAS